LPPASRPIFEKASVRKGQGSRPGVKNEHEPNIRRFLQGPDGYPVPKSRPVIAFRQNAQPARVSWAGFRKARSTAFKFDN